MGSGSAGGWTPAAVTLAAAAAAAAGAAITYCALAQRPAELAAPERPPAPAAADHDGADCSCSVEVVEEAAPKVDPFDRRPRKGYLSWEDYFMAVAFLSARRSKDPNKQVGACIVGPDKIILGIGYNGFPRGCADDKLPWARRAHSGDPLDTKYPYVCHAELNAILNKNVASLNGAALYVTMFPCCECAKLLIQAGIREVVYFEDKAAPARPASASLSGIRPEALYAASRTLLALAGVRVRQHRLERPLVLRIGC